MSFDDGKLKLIGWGGRKPKAPPQAPGRTRNLKITHQGEGTISLRWKAPAKGGRTAAYKIQRLDRIEVDSPWIDMATAIETSITITNQTHGKQFEFRVVAINRAGEGMPSDTVVALL
uniref:Fibronectin type III domain-containing protein n=1 Tax=Candidatus Kentrum sp. TUN TaxID=2126343 RepID=A0A450ZWF3_9GAMM|nr:MAG: Fibronectin type III domain-containing protein [Candidatus Kentron sp. TUN]